MTLHTRRGLLLATAAALPACALPGAEQGREAPLPRVRVGDRWRYQVIDRYRDRLVESPIVEVAEVAPELVLRVTGRGSVPVPDERYAAPWSVLQETVYGITMRFDEPVPLVPLPTPPGAGSTRVVSYTVPGETRTRRWSQRLSIDGWETVTVPAGRYDSLRISRVIAFDHPDTGRNASTRTDRLWYAPAVNRWVRREWRGEYVSAGIGDNPSEGTRATEDWLEWRLAAWLPSPVSG
jgi:hypothetical protein